MSLNWNLVLIIVIIVLIIGGGIALYFALNAPPEANLANLGDKCTSHTDCKNWGPGARNAACCTDPQGGGGKTCQNKFNGWCWDQAPINPTYKGTIFRTGIDLGVPKTCAQSYPGRDAFWDPNGSCWACPSGYGRTFGTVPVTDPKACARIGSIGDYASAEKLREGLGPAGLELLGNNISYKGRYWTCPPGTGQGIRTGPIDQPNGCSGTCAVLYGPRSSERGLTGQCYDCPPGYSYLLDRCRSI